MLMMFNPCFARLYLAVAVLSLIPVVLGWGAAGHEIVATIAQIHLHPTVFPKICDILNFTSTNPNEPPCHLAPIAAWADRIRFKMRWSAPLHYIGAVGDHPSQTCVFPGERGWAGRQGANLLGGIRNTTGILEEWNEYDDMGSMTDAVDERANEALKFLVHFLGDMHMPLHLTGRNRGGNSDKVLFDGRQTNLHSLWDGLLIAKGLRTVPRNYSRPLPFPQIEYALRGTIYDSYVRRLMWEGILGQWKNEVPSWLSCPPPTPSPSSTGGVWRQVVLRWNRLTRNTVEETDDDILCPHYWAEPIHKLNCEIVWPKELDEPPYNHSRLEDDSEYAGRPGTPPGGGPYLELDTPQYTGVISERWIVEKLLAQGGIRLAGVLNWLFADLEEGELKRGLTVIDI